MIKWIIVAILFVGDVPINSKIFQMPPEIQTAADCEKERADFEKQAKEKDVDIWLDCVEVKREVKPMRGEPGTEQRS